MLTRAYICFMAGSIPLRIYIRSGTTDDNNLTWLRQVKNWIDGHNAKSAVVVGGGFIGMEMAENLVHLGLKVTLVEGAGQVETTPLTYIAQRPPNPAPRPPNTRTHIYTHNLLLTTSMPKLA